MSERGRETVDSDVNVGIDIGDHKVCVLVADMGAEGQPRIIGVGTTPAHGMNRGMVVSVDELAGCVSTAIERAQRMSGYEIHRAEVSVTGSQISSVNSRGVVAVSRPNHEITEADVERAIEAARAIPLPNNREVLHVIPRFYIVDGQEGVPNPVGMFGFRLEVEAHIITASSTALQNLQRCLEKAKVSVRDMVACPLAAAESVLTQEEKEMGAIVADIGGGSTGICIYSDNAPWHTTALRVGGILVSKDLTVGLRVPFNTAEDIKIRYGHAVSSTIDPQETVDVPGASRESRTILRQRECEIIEDRMAEVFAMILNEIKKSGHDGMLPGGVVLTGGSAELPGMVELGREILGLPVRVGSPQGMGGVTDSITGPAYAASVGVLQWAWSHERQGGGGGTSPSWGGALQVQWGKLVQFFKRAFGGQRN